ncbi:tail fiber domain-containing protein [Dyadobacter arcticus]|uniref:Peptidase S74 domain-containing protein n=1 Tax=Dyadobacter arcticus TaxID=1078754 RepID=A0ABX0UL76_9BACT|nr:tail fiber domain-containing protein [Dyadobacter arcticus]NIJ53762.1 hypothetical protein [Dyadobacter arcticus]
MRSFIKIFLFVTLALSGYAQAPQKFSFQGVAKDAAGKAVANANIGLRFSIIQHADDNVVVYQETQNTTTSSSGVFTVLVGAGSVKSGSFNISWDIYEHSLKVELDATGGTNYVDLGLTKMSSVPYALFAGEADRWKNNTPIIQTGDDDQGGFLPQLDPGNMLIWYPRKGAFKVGRNLPFNTAWEDNKTGKYSASFGLNSESSGLSSTSIGSNNVASGKSSFSAGDNTFAKAQSSTSIGQFNNKDDNPSNTPIFFDRIFQIGNGSSEANRSNALTVLRSGKIGIGDNVLAPEFILDIGSRPRIRHNENTTAGVLLDDFNNIASAFMGMKSNTEIGFYHNGKWSFWVDGQGNAHIASGILSTSDKRLKRNITPLSNTLAKLTELNGYRYFWKDGTLDQSIQTGVIAQEVEALFPDLVKTDEQGFKSVNYNGLIPHLIESVKELNASLNALQSDKNRLKSENKALKAQASQITAMQQEMSQLKDSLHSIEASLKATSNGVSAKTSSGK